MPKISIIVPVYGVERYLARCLDSILNQTFRNFEVICVNDGSPDNCGVILADYAVRDNRIRIITQENKGLSAARNNGLKQATGTYVLFVDSDDYIHPQLLERTLAVIEQSHADIVCFSFQNTLPDTPVFFPLLEPSKVLLTDYPLTFCRKRCSWRIFFNVWSKLYRRDFIADLSFMEGICFEDFPYILSLMAKRPKTAIIKDKLYYYVDNESSITHRALTPRHIYDYHAGLCAIYETYQSCPVKDWRFVRRIVFPNILKQQLHRIYSSATDKQSLLWMAFAHELRDLKRKGCLPFCGHKLKYYWMYCRLLKGKMPL